eukprot:SAG22_NODE_2612_length_2381_cov_2.086766_3_plen_244_part_00
MAAMLRSTKLSDTCAPHSAVGCDRCDGSSRGPIPGQGGGPATSPPTGIGRNKVGPNGVVCNASNANGLKPTMCDPKLRTINQAAACGGPEDWYFFSPVSAATASESFPRAAQCTGARKSRLTRRPLLRPQWRAPGAAPVLDACGVAGGHQPPNGRFGGIYVNTTHAKLGAKLRRVAARSRFVDSLPALVADLSLSQAFWLKDAFLNLFKSCLDFSGALSVCLFCPGQTPSLHTSQLSLRLAAC